MNQAAPVEIEFTCLIGPLIECLEICWQPSMLRYLGYGYLPLWNPWLCPKNWDKKYIQCSYGTYVEEEINKYKLQKKQQILSILIQITFLDTYTEIMAFLTHCVHFAVLLFSDMHLKVYFSIQTGWKVMSEEPAVLHWLLRSPPPTWFHLTFSSSLLICLYLSLSLSSLWTVLLLQFATTAVAFVSKCSHWLIREFLWKLTKQFLK